MKIIVGLGNPGGTYAHNRHNVGFLCLNYFAKRHSIKFDRRECLARTGAGEVSGEMVLLAKPGVFVNFSGKAVGKLVRKYDIALDDLLVVYDDLDLPPGKIRVRRSGGSGGHNGVKSIISVLGSANFPRIKVGIGRPVMPDGIPSNCERDIIDYVLGKFSPQQDEMIGAVIATVAESLECILERGVDAAMNMFN